MRRSNMDRAGGKSAAVVAVVTEPRFTQRYREYLEKQKLLERQHRVEKMPDGTVALPPPLPPPPPAPARETRAGGGVGRERNTRGGRAGAESPAFASAPGHRPAPCPTRPCPARPAPVWQRLMAAVGPPQQQVRMAHQQVWAALEVALRVPCLYIIDAIFNSYYDSSQSRFCIGLQILLRLLVNHGSLHLRG
ncbi:E3 ubiquitin-protein ligase RNF139 isoform X4 [Balaenoptera musculus]|uniref:E3 ubiquitin-protein ligase RNF139 isoform X4 n=1 Tax=Balaenoptera musculus TaxID=9771 RepID=A0A8B8VN27_BALMU|nr:E3 ubiquitin-protein ligase RNF139 isoform X4 [Balaenoptera musculus]